MTRLAATATTRKSASVDTQNQKLLIPVSPAACLRRIVSIRRMFPDGLS